MPQSIRVNLVYRGALVFYKSLITTWILHFEKNTLFTPNAKISFSSMTIESHCRVISVLLAYSLLFTLPCMAKSQLAHAFLILIQ